ncbi:helix-turn-helix transcriptional regulator [Halogeometricum luteum]|uniref:ArsR family transcriptional regulator n=1 Tax=Halogeometricum luteum TaxID=2950537 RepID=A0ABU2FXL5_9EURY|nr:ArsR family transcriptional regulator [Halogeometricum sp. S3BR5-2]MDS0293282.1 ArsR family transcriptional regulator [Halogeometricum sp. S3BR5-2]
MSEFSPDALDDVRFVSQSPARVRLLSLLVEGGPMNRCELRAGVDASRTTVSRNLDALVDRGWVEESDGDYRAAPGGELLAAGLESFLSTVETVDRLAPFFEWFPADGLDLPSEWLADADVYPSTPADPYAPIDRHVERLEVAAEFRGLLPATGLRPMRSLGRRLESFEHELVVSPSVAETIRNERKYLDAIDELRERGRIEFYVSDRAVPLYVGLFEGDVQLGVGDGDGVPRAMVETADERVRRWAEETYDAHRTGAEPLR